MELFDDAILLRILKFVNFDHRGHLIIRTCRRFKELYFLIIPSLPANQLLELGCRSGNSVYISSAIEKGANNWNDGLRAACYEGHLPLVNLMIEKGANDWNGGLHKACCGGHLLLAKLMIEKGATPTQEYYNLNASRMLH